MRDDVVAIRRTCIFFFQAEDGIRDDLVTGVQTCALPISRVGLELKEMKILEDAKDFFSREFKAEIQVGQEGEKTVNDPKDRARSAEPFRQIGRASCRERV